MTTLKQYRLEIMVSRSQVARVAGVAPETVARVEEGKPIRELKAIQLARGLSELLGRKIEVSDIEGLVVYEA